MCDQQPEPGVLERGVEEGLHGKYSNEDVVRHLREAADFIESNRGGVRRFTRVVTDDYKRVGVRQWGIHLTYLDSRKD